MSRISRDHVDNFSAEIWVPIAGFEGAYEVSSAGRVRSLRPNKKRRSNDGTIAQLKHTGGYLMVNLCANGKREQHFVHRLVAKGFLPNPKSEVNHLDGHKTNNSLSNLEWVDRGENARHAYAAGLMQLPTSGPGEANGRAKLTEHEVVWIRAWLQSGFIARTIAPIFGVLPSTISGIRTRNTWRHVP